MRCLKKRRTGGRPKGLINKYDEIKYFVKDTYDKKNATIDEIMKAYKISSKTTFYKILKSAENRVLKI